MEGPSDIRGAAQPPHSPGAPIQLTPAGTPAFEGLCSTDRRGEPAPLISVRAKPKQRKEATAPGFHSGAPGAPPGGRAARAPRPSRPALSCRPPPLSLPGPNPGILPSQGLSPANVTFWF